MDRSLASAFDNLSQIDKKEPENNMRSMMSSLSQSIDKVWQIDKKKYHKLIKKIEKMNLLVAWDLSWLHYHSLLIKYQRLIKDIVCRMKWKVS